MFSRKTEMVSPSRALPGRDERPFSLPERHAVLDAPLVTDEIPTGMDVAIFGLGCFWGAEELFWQVPGVWSTSVGYAGGITPNPTYEEVCTGRTGHTEAVRVVFDPEQVSYRELVKAFYEMHDPTQGMRQGNDVGTQYRSAIFYTNPKQEYEARQVTGAYEPVLKAAGYGAITTEIEPWTEYWYAEEAHQQYLHKVPHGYRCHSATGVSVPAGA